MIIFDTKSSNITQLKRLLATRIDAVSTLENCIQLLNVDTWIHTLMLGTGALTDDFVNWVISMQPPIRNIIVYEEQNDTLNILVNKLRQAQYTINYIPFDTIKERLQ